MSEAAFQPEWFSKPGDTLFTLLNKRKLSPAMLAEQMGYDLPIVQRLLAGTVAIDTKIAIRLSKVIGGSPTFWTRRQTQFDETLDQAAHAISPERTKSWLKILPLKEMMEAGWIAPSSERHAALKSSLSYFDVTDPDEWKERYTVFQNEFSFRTSQNFESKIGALSAWLRQGEIQAAAISCDTWNPDRLQARLADIRVLTKAKSPTYFIPKLQAICSEAGIAVVFVRAPSGCRASGATRFIAPTKAMIVLSFRHLSDDHFWFTFFHEIGHLLLHGKADTFIDGEEADQTKREAEANTFSAGILIPHKKVSALMSTRPRTLNVIRFAISIGVSPGIIVGQMQHRGLIGPNQLNHLKRRYNWEEIASAVN